MIPNVLKLPVVARASIFFIGLLALFAMLYIAKSIIIPIVFSLIMAIVLLPVVNFFVRIKINRVVAISLTLLLTFVVLAALGTFIFSQASRFSDSWPTLVEKFTGVLNDTANWAANYFDINPHKIDAWLLKTKGELINASGPALGKTLIGVGNAVMILCLVPVYIFLILYYQPNLVVFVHKVFGAENDVKVNQILTQTKSVIQRYLSGLAIEFVMVAILNSVVLLILGIDYAILLGILGALLNLIPYIGGLVAVALPMMIALATKDSAWYAMYVLVGYYIIQLIDNNIIVPKVVASKVKINALFSIIAVLAGGALWGVTGMFLSIPLLAIIKLIFDNVDPFKPWGYILGDTMPPLKILNPVIKIIKRKSKK
jgi:predicted PurR-regulated permease PerM